MHLDSDRIHKEDVEYIFRCDFTNIYAIEQLALKDKYKWFFDI